MLRSRVLTGIDPHRLGSAVSYPGIDPRIWVSYGACTSDPYIETIAGEQDIFVDVLLLPSRIPHTARVGAIYAGNGFGFYTPLKKDDEVLICAPSGDPDEGMVITQRLWSPSDPPPSALTTYPEDVTLVVESGKNLRLNVQGGGKVYLGGNDATLGVARLNDKVLIGTQTVVVTVLVPSPPSGTVTKTITSTNGIVLFTETLPWSGTPPLPSSTPVYGTIAEASTTVVAT